MAGCSKGELIHLNDCSLNVGAEAEREIPPMNCS